VKVLVTGADGFVGRRLVGTLQRRGFSVLASVRKTEASLPLGVEFVNLGDLRSSPEWGSALRGIDAVIHLAARAHIVNERSRDPIAEFREVNVRPTISLYQACQRAAVARFVFVSSIGVNGVSTHGRPFSETDVPNPIETYGQSKWEAEQGLLELRSRASTDLVIVRPALIYGPRAKGNLLKLMRWVNRGWFIPLGSVSAARSFLSLTYFCDLLSRCVTNVNAADQLFLAADPEPISTVAMVQAIAHSMHRHAKLIRVSPQLLQLLAYVTGRSRELDRLTASLVVDSSKAKAVLDWAGSTSFVDDVQGMVEQYLQTESVGG
jgi:nucleoside-diphosphate-sugar epimerase